MRLPLVRFLIADGIGAVIGNCLLFFLGYWFGDAFMDLILPVEKEAERLRPLLIVIGLGGVGLYLLYHFLRSPVTAGDPKEIPLIGSQVAARIDSESKRVSDNGQLPTPAEHAEPLKTASHGDGTSEN
jgi:hypothetical protein